MNQPNEIGSPHSILSDKLLIYVLTSSILKISSMYFTQDALDALASSEKELIQGLKDLDEGASVNDLMVAVFSKERLH